jgi:hypothetical protein
MAVLGRLEVDWVGKVELLDDDTRSQVKVVLDYLDELVGRFVGCAVCLNEDGKGLGDTDGVGELDKCTTSQFGINKRLSDPPSKVGSWAVDFGVVLAGEGTTTMSTPATIGIDDNLTASQAGITLRATNDEEARRLDLNNVSEYEEYAKY